MKQNAILLLYTGSDTVPVLTLLTDLRPSQTQAINQSILQEFPVMYRYLFGINQ
jgi:hypothetical protein